MIGTRRRHDPAKLKWKKGGIGANQIDAVVAFLAEHKRMSLFSAETISERVLRRMVDDSDLRTTLRAVLGSGTSDTQVDRIVDQLKTRFDVNGDGVLEEREFAQLLTKDDIAQRFTMRLH